MPLAQRNAGHVGARNAAGHVGRPLNLHYHITQGNSFKIINHQTYILHLLQDHLMLINIIQLDVRFFFFSNKKHDPFACLNMSFILFAI